MCVCVYVLEREREKREFLLNDERPHLLEASQRLTGQDGLVMIKKASLSLNPHLSLVLSPSGTDLTDCLLLVQANVIIVHESHRLG